MVIRDKTYTADAFFALVSERDDDRRFELVEEYIVEIAPPKSINSYIAGRVLFHLTLYDPDNEVGYAFGADGGFALSATDVRIPDASFVAKERIQDKMPDLIPNAPDLVVEIISPSETPASINEKTRLYFGTGAKVVWIIYPDDRLADIRTPSHEGFHVVTVGLNDTLHAKSVLPNFELPLSKVFPKPQPEQEA